MKKKYITLLSASLLIISPAIAEKQFISSEILPYLRLDSGWSHFRSVHGITYISTNNKLKSNTNNIVGAGAGLGINLGDKIRSDITWSHHLGAKLDWENQGNLVKRKPVIDAYFLNFYYETGFALSVFHPYVGAGVGLAAVKDNLSYSVVNNNSLSYGNYVINKKNNFAYKFILGSAFDLNDQIKFDLSYNYSDYGKSKGIYTSSNILIGKTPYRAHVINAGLRFGI